MFSIFFIYQKLRLPGLKSVETFSDFLISENVMKYRKNENLNYEEKLASLKEFAVW